MKFLSFMNTRLGRGIRVMLGVAVLAAGAVVGGGLGTGLMLFSVAPIATGLFGVCPFNPLFGRSMRACSVPQQRVKAS